MKLSVSNIAWTTADDADVAALLARNNVRAIDLAPTKYWPVLAKATRSEVMRVRDWWHEREIDIIGLQSLFYGTQGLNVFGDHEVQEAALHHLNHVCAIGAWLGASKLTFGSPQNRNIHGLSPQQATNIAIQFFQKLGDIAASHNVTICLEANPAAYGCNFMTTTLEALSVVETTNHPAIRLQFDGGAMTMNGEDPNALMPSLAPWLGHIHISEPHLVTIGEGATDHAAMARALRDFDAEALCSIEMLPPKVGSPLEAIQRALHTTTLYYM